MAEIMWQLGGKEFQMETNRKTTSNGLLLVAATICTVGAYCLLSPVVGPLALYVSAMPPALLAGIFFANR
jgi:hypothetical protein